MSDDPVRNISYPGPPTHGSYNLWDEAIDSAGEVWVCNTPGKASAGGTATFVSPSTSGLALAPVFSAVSVTATPGQYVNITASGQTVTLPATPALGTVVGVAGAYGASGGLGNLMVSAGAGATVNGVASLNMSGADAPNYGSNVSALFQYVAANAWQAIAAVGTDLGGGMNVGGPNNLAGALYLKEPVTHNANYTTVATDQVIHMTGVHTLTLTGDENGRAILVNAFTSSATQITVVGATGTVGGQSSIKMPPGSSAIFVFNGTSDWGIYAGSPASNSNTSLTAAASTPTPTTGTAFVPAAFSDCELSFAVATGGSYTVTMGPSTGAENTVLTSTALAIGTFFNKRIPQGWSVIITGTIGNLENILAVTC